MRIKRRALSLLLCLCLCAALSLPALAADTGAKVVFAASTPDANGYFTLTMTMANATFNAFQFAVRFDPSTVCPVSADGTAAEDFSGFAVKKAAWLSTIGTSVNAQTWFMGFTGYVSPGESADCITNGEAVIGSGGVVLFAFRFRVTADGDPAFKIATQAQGEPYEHSFPEGSGIMGRAGSSTGAVTFDLSALKGGTSTTEGIAGNAGGAGGAELTASQLVEKCLMLQIGNHAVSDKGGVTAFYSGENEVVPYINGDNRTLVPVRFVAEKMGASVDWDEASRTVIIVLNGKTIRMPIDSRTYTVDGVAHTMDTAAVLPAHGRTMVPVRFVAEALGLNVGWDAAYNMVIIAPADCPWTDGGATEAEAVKEANAMLLMYGNFV